MRSTAILAWSAALLAVLFAGCGRSELSSRPRGPVVTPDGGVDGGACETDLQCDDGLVCNGSERCVAGGCADGPPPSCDDGVECTIDRCEESAAGCASIPDSSRCPPGTLCDPSAGGCVARPCASDVECDDRVFCNGQEICLGGACTGGAPPRCDTGDPCVEARCDFALDACVATPVDRDRDGHIPRECGGNDCDDTNPRVHPGVTEQCKNGVDDDCNGPTDCEDPACVGIPTCMCAPIEFSCGDGRDEDCDGLLDCADPDCAGDSFCVCAAHETACFDMRDEDCDALLDCADPDCSAQPGCRCATFETCGNGRDDDCDGQIDCRDSECAADPSCMVRCDTIDLGSMFGMRVATGSTRGRPNGLTPSCRAGGTAGEQAFAWRAPTSGTFTIDTFGSSYDTVLYVLGSCPGAELPGACDDDTMGLQSRVTITVMAGQSVVIVVDGFGASEGDYVLNITSGTAEICNNGADDDGDGFVDCADTECASSPICCTPRPENCSNGVDDDCDTRADCSDFDCRTAPTCCVPRPEVCGNGVDDDCDALIDCADSSCRTDPSCCMARPEICNNGVDDDCDAQIDCVDASCRFDPACCVPRPEVCNNFTDDDCDLRRDCFDPDCASDPACCMPSPEVCNDSRDNDCDRLVDCADPSCATSPACCVPSPEVCNDGRDNDCDRLVDCGDPSCATSPACCVPVPEVCDDGVDQDCDRLADCADPDCRSAPACCVPSPEVCTNFADDDCDRLIDCGDPDCASAPACCVASPEICDDGADQDCDGLIDCADMDCATAPACRPCPDRDLGSRLGRVSTGTTVGQLDDVSPSCVSSTAPDLTFRWTAPFAGDFMIDTNGSTYDTALAILAGCGGPELACDDDSGTGTQSLIRLRLSAGQTIVIAVDGWGMSSGAYVLNIAALIAGESNCTDGVDNDFDGDVDCADMDCAGSPSCGP